MIFTNRLFMSRLGPEQMSAVMLGGLCQFMMTTFFIGLTGYTTALVAQYYGSNQKERCGTVINQAILISLIGFPIILALSPLVLLYFDVSGIASEQLKPQKIYFSIVIFESIFGLLRTSLSGFFTGIGKTRCVMVAAIVSMVVNIAFNYVLIFGKFGLPSLGIHGAAISIIVGGLAGFLVLLFYYMNFEHKEQFGIRFSLRLDKTVMMKLVKFGSPAGLEMFLNLVAFSLMIGIFHSHSLVTAVAATIVFNWDMVSFVPMIGIQIGVTSLVGRHMGAGLPDMAHKTTLSGLAMTWSYSSLVLIAFAFFPNYLVDLFKPSEASQVFNEARPLAIFMVRLAAVYVMIDATFVVFTGALRGAGDTLWAMIITVVLHWALIPVLYTILNILHWSARAGWVALVIIFVSFSGFIYWRYSTGKWRTIKMVEPV